MRNLCVLLSLLVIASCNSNQDGKKTKSNPDYQVAIDFINSYKNFCDKRTSSQELTYWLMKNNLITDSFKATYKELIDKAYENEPELGLDFDPIFDAQDYPDEGFKFLVADKNKEFIIVNGIDWQEFNVTMKVIQIDNKWLVDGCGIINIPEDKISRK